MSKEERRSLIPGGGCLWSVRQEDLESKHAYNKELPLIAKWRDKEGFFFIESETPARLTQIISNDIKVKIHQAFLFLLMHINIINDYSDEQKIRKESSMWQYTKDILPWWVLYNTNVLFNVSVGMINKKKVKTKKSYSVK